MKAVPYILGISQGVVKEMAGYSHTLPCCVSKLRSSLEAGKKQPRVWLQYVCGVIEMLLYPSSGVSLVLLLSPYGDSKMARNGFLDPSGKAEREDGSKWYATTNVYGMDKEAGFVPLRTYVNRPMNLWPLRNKNKTQDTSVTL